MDADCPHSHSRSNVDAEAGLVIEDPMVERGGTDADTPTRPRHRNTSNSEPSRSSASTTGGFNSYRCNTDESDKSGDISTLQQKQQGALQIEEEESQSGRDLTSIRSDASSSIENPVSQSNISSPTSQSMIIISVSDEPVSTTGASGSKATSGTATERSEEDMEATTTTAGIVAPPPIPPPPIIPSPAPPIPASPIPPPPELIRLPTAQIVSAAMDEQARQRIIAETRQSMIMLSHATAVPASDFGTAPLAGGASSGSSSKNNSSRSSDAYNNNGSKQRRALYCAALLLILIMAIVGSVLGVVLTSQSLSSPLPPPTFPTSAPTGYWEGSTRAFRSTEQLYKAVDDYILAATAAAANNASSSSPETSEVALRFGYPIGTWNVSLITDFSRLFDPERNLDLETRLSRSKFGPEHSFNEDLSGWDVSNAINMSGMFLEAVDFEGKGLSDWNVGKVRDFSFAFWGATRFLGIGLSAWDMSSAVTMRGMFEAAVSFAADIPAWDTGSVLDMGRMVRFCTASRAHTRAHFLRFDTVGMICRV